MEDKVRFNHNEMGLIFTMSLVFPQVTKKQLLIIFKYWKFWEIEPISSFDIAARNKILLLSLFETYEGSLTPTKFSLGNKEKLKDPKKVFVAEGFSI